MEKFTAKIDTSNGEGKTVSVWLDEGTAQVLRASGDEELIRRYVIEEYKASLIERKETRRHQSLEKSTDKGFDVVDDSVNIEEQVIKNFEYERLHKAIKQLEPQQQWLIEQIFFLERTQTSVAKELGVDKTSIRDRLQTIYKKIRTFF